MEAREADGGNKVRFTRWRWRWDEAAASQETEAGGEVLVPSWRVSFRRRTLRKPLEKEGPAFDGGD